MKYEQASYIHLPPSLRRPSIMKMNQPRNTDRKGRISTVELLAKIACFSVMENKIHYIELDRRTLELNTWMHSTRVGFVLTQKH